VFLTTKPNLFCQLQSFCLPGNETTTTVDILCESVQASTAPPLPPQLVGGSPQCALGSTEL
jgi:hypothetical protein